MSDKFVKPGTNEEVFRVDDSGKEIVNDKYKHLWSGKDEFEEQKCYICGTKKDNEAKISINADESGMPICNNCEE